MSIFDEDRLVTPELLTRFEARLTLCFTKYDDGYRVTGELDTDMYYYRLKERTIKYEIDFISFMHRMYELNYKHLFEDFELIFS